MTFYDDVVQVFKFNPAEIAKILRNEEVFISPFHGLAKIGKLAKKVDAFKE